MSEDDHIFWEDTLERVQAGRTSNLKCPFCREGAIVVTKIERATRLQCQNRGCGHYIEGRFKSEDVAAG